jgi:uncharacterized protein
MTHRTVDPEHGFGLLSQEDQDKMELIVSDRSEGSYGAPALQGLLTASVVGPKPVPLEWILQGVLSPPESEEIDFDLFPEFNWVAEKTEEWFLRIVRVFKEDPEVFRLLVYMPKLKEGDNTPDPQTWCNGFVEAMAYQREEWEPCLVTEQGFLALAPILMTSDPDEWDDKDIINPFTEMTPWALCDALKMGTLAIHTFWSNYEARPGPIRASDTPRRNDRCPCGSGRKYKRCCGRQA